MLILALVACLEPSGPEAPPVPLTLSTWLTAQPDELHPYPAAAHTVRYVYEDEVRLPPGTRGATLVALVAVDRTTARCDRVQLHAGTLTTRDDRSTVPWSGWGRQLVHHRIPTELLETPFEIYVGVSAPCGPPALHEANLLLHVEQARPAHQR